MESGSWDNQLEAPRVPIVVVQSTLTNIKHTSPSVTDIRDLRDLKIRIYIKFRLLESYVAISRAQMDLVDL